MVQITQDRLEFNKIQALNKKVILITNSQRPYIQKILMKLSERNPENAGAICDYILSEQVVTVCSSKVEEDDGDGEELA